MNRIPLDEMYLLYSLYGFRDLTEEEQSRFTITRFEYAPSADFFSADMKFEYENECGLKAILLYELAGKRSEDHFFEHVLYKQSENEIEFPNFREAMDYCNQLSQKKH